MAVVGYRYMIKVNNRPVDSTSIIENAGELFLTYCAKEENEYNDIDLVDTFTGELLGRSVPTLEAEEIINYDNCSDCVATFTPDQFDAVLNAVYR